MDLSLTDGLRTTGAARSFLDREVDPATVMAILDDARFAPSGGNRQPWKVCWVRDPDRRRRLADLTRPVWNEYAARASSGIPPFSVRSVRPAGEIEDLPNPLLDELHTAPVVLVVAADLTRIAVMDGELDRPAITGGASVYPFCWSVLLAARARGLGGVLTTYVARAEPRAAELLALPADHAAGGLVVLGYAEHQPTRLKRRPVQMFATVDTFDGGPLDG